MVACRVNACNDRSRSDGGSRDGTDVIVLRGILFGDNKVIFQGFSFELSLPFRFGAAGTQTRGFRMAQDLDARNGPFLGVDADHEFDLAAVPTGIDSVDITVGFAAFTGFLDIADEVSRGLFLLEVAQVREDLLVSCFCISFMLFGNDFLGPFMSTGNEGNTGSAGDEKGGCQFLRRNYSFF